MAAVWEKREAWKMIECIRDRGEQPCTHRLNAPVWPEEEGSQEGGGQSTEEIWRKNYIESLTTMVAKR